MFFCNVGKKIGEWELDLAHLNDPIYDHNGHDSKPLLDHSVGNILIDRNLDLLLALLDVAQAIECLPQYTA